jgi:myo-inositol catabolism protein IolC
MERRPMVSAPNDSWLPSPSEPLFILAMDHRASFAKDLFDVTGPPAPSDLARMRQAKTLIYEGLRHFAGGVRSGREGVLVDEDFGADVVRSAKSDGLVVLMPIEKSGQEVFELEYGDRFAEHVEKFDPDFCKALVRYNPLDDEKMRRTQVTRLATVSQWAERADRRWLIELLVPPTPQQLATCGDQAGFDRGARPELTAEAITQLQAGQVRPTIWKLEGYETTAAADVVLTAVANDAAHPAQCIVLGRDAPLPRVEHWLKVAAQRPFVGFAVGRTIWEESLRRFLRGAISEDEVIEQVADNYATLVETYIRASRGSSGAPSQGGA